MFKKKFGDLNYISNFQSKKNLKKLLIFPGLGCEAREYEFLFRLSKLKYHIYIFELPGHNNSNCSLKNDYLMMYARKIFFFLKKNNIKFITVYTHSMSYILLVLIIRFFFGYRLHIEKIINFEGNLIQSDTSILTKKTVSYDLNYYKEIGFNNLINRCNKSEDPLIKIWSKSLKKVSPINFYLYSKSIFLWSKQNFLLSYFKNRFNNKIYLYGQNSKNLELINRIFGIRKFCFKKSGHFSHLNDKVKFKSLLFKLLKGN